MWDLTIRGVDFYHLISWFFVYSFLGWLWETCYVSAKCGKYVNRGFVNGPLCTIYGFGALCVYLILKPFEDNYLLLFLGGIVVSTVLEYVTAVLMESVFHTSWWDYSDKKFNFQGRICLGASLGWGFFTILLFKVLHPIAEYIVGLFPVFVGKIAVCVITAGYGVDFCFSAAAAFRLHDKLPAIEQALEQARDEMLVKMHKKLAGMEFAKASTLENVKERLEDVNVLKEIEQKRLALASELNDELQRRKEAMAAKLGHNMRRFVKAYPNLNRRYRLHNQKNKNIQPDKANQTED
ncbi:MAG: hypothetical protein SO401_03975 [Blautia sp.]|nr:hypothetical protein [Blautia sp.]